MEPPIGQTLTVLAETIRSRRDAGNESYTYRLLTGNPDNLLKKLVEEASELTLAAKDELADPDNDSCKAHARYEAGDVVYHLLVILERLGISLDDLAAELNTRMTPEELAATPNAPTFAPEEINRGR